MLNITGDKHFDKIRICDVCIHYYGQISEAKKLADRVVLGKEKDNKVNRQSPIKFPRTHILINKVHGSLLSLPIGFSLPKVINRIFWKVSISTKIIIATPMKYLEQN